MNNRNEAQVPLSSQDRLCLILTLNALPKIQFDELVFALNPPNGNIPSDSAPQGERSAKLLAWADSPSGPGLHAIDAVLSSLIGDLKSKNHLAFVIHGKINKKTTEELATFVNLLRKKTGDNSIEISFEDRPDIS